MVIMSLLLVGRAVVQVMVHQSSVAVRMVHYQELERRIIAAFTGWATRLMNYRDLCLHARTYLPACTPINPSIRFTAIHPHPSCASRSMAFNGIAIACLVYHRIVLNWILQIFTDYCLADLQQRRSAATLICSFLKRIDIGKP